MSAFFIGNATMQVPAGILNTKLGSKPLLTFAMSGISEIIVLLVVSPVLADYGWQRAFWMIAGASVIVGIILRLVLPSDKHAKNLTTDITEEKPVAEDVPAAKLLEVISEPFVWLLGILNFTINAMMYGMINWMPSYLI